MKQGNTYTKLILWIFLIAVVFYFGFYIFSAVYSPLTTAAAIEYEAGAGSYVTGYVVRQEDVIESDYGITAMVVSEGERVAKGQTLATGYGSEDAQDRQGQIHELENQLEQLEYAFSYSADASAQAALDSEIRAQLVRMNRYITRRDMNSAADSSAALKGLVLRRMSSKEDNAAMNARIEILTTSLEALREDAVTDTLTITAGSSGCYSGAVDGYEKVLTVESLSTLTAEQLREITPGTVSDTNIGKLILGSTWYYVTVVPAEQLTEVREGDDVSVTFAADLYEELEMTVSRIGKEENGSCLLVLACDRYMQDITLLREQSADVVFSSHKGLRVPKDAVRVMKLEDIYPDLKTDADYLKRPAEERAETYVGVFILEGSTASWKQIHILHDNGESYVVELDKSDTDNLWPGDEIIVGAKNLYEGKVVR